MAAVRKGRSQGMPLEERLVQRGRIGGWRDGLAVLVVGFVETGVCPVRMVACYFLFCCLLDISIRAFPSELET